MPRCDACDARVSTPGGIADLWSFGDATDAGMTLELADGSEHFLCLPCLDKLPDEPTAADIAALE